MFKKLRNKFLILNLVTISVMMLIAFSSIYIITYRNVNSDIDMELHRILEFNRKPIDKPKPPIKPQPNFESTQPNQERSVSFRLITDQNYNIESIISFFDMDNEFYEKAKISAISKNANTGKFKLDSAYWAFIINEQPDGVEIAFLNVSSQQDILTGLIYTFIAAAIIMLFLIYLVSRIFANKAIKPVKEAFEKQIQFIADASHELKTPLAVINTNVDVLLTNREDSIENQSKWLYYIKSESERMSKLTSDLLFLTEMDYSEIKMISANFNLSTTVENVILTMEAVIFEHNVSLDYNIEPDLICHGNNEQIQQVVMILLDNAVKYTNPNGEINISLKRNNHMATFTITNTGEGISEEHINKIFDRFYRTDKSRARKSGGHGLGLAIAKAIIEQNNGKITVKSVLNQSTTFTVELPCINI